MATEKVVLSQGSYVAIVEAQGNSGGYLVAPSAVKNTDVVQVTSATFTPKNRGVQTLMSMGRVRAIVKGNETAGTVSLVMNRDIAPLIDPLKHYHIEFEDTDNTGATKYHLFTHCAVNAYPQQSRGANTAVPTETWAFTAQSSEMDQDSPRIFNP